MKPRARHFPTALLAGAILLLTSFGAPAFAGKGEPSAPDEKTENKPTLAVMPFARARNAPPDARWLAELTAEILYVKLTQAPAVCVVERSEVAKQILREEYRSRDLSDPEFAAAIGKDLHADRVVTGNLTLKGGSLALQLLVLDVETATLLPTKEITGTFGKFPEFNAALARAARDTLKNLPAEPPAAWSTPLAASPRAYKALGQGAVEKNDSAALKFFAQALAADPRCALGYHLRGKAHLLRRRFAQALADFDRAIELDPAGRYVFGPRGLTRHFMAGESGVKPDRLRALLALAVEDYNRALAVNPKSPDLHKQRGLAYRGLGDQFRAIEDFTVSWRLQADPMTLFYRAECRHANAEYNRAIEDYDAILEKTPDDLKVIFSRGLSHHGAGLFEKAVEDFTTVLKARPNLANALQNRALSYASLLEHDKAVADCNAALNIEPKNAKTYLIRAMAYLGKEDFTRAKADVAAIEKLGENVPAWLTEGIRKAEAAKE